MRVNRKVGIIATAASLALVSMLVAGCAPKVATGGDDDGTTDVATVEWSPDSDCSMCHEETLSHSLIGEGATGHADLKCVDCHEDVNGLAEAHEDASGPSDAKKLKKTEVTDETCISCHGDWSDLAEATADVTVLTDSNGTTVNPHEITTVHNESGQHDQMTCATCHNPHGEETSDVVAANECITCHHQDVYECYTCHE